MSRFTGGTSGQAPLRLQLGPVPGLGVVYVSRVEASGENESGAASFPAITIPGQAGDGTQVFVVNETGETANVPLISNFTTAPSLPVLSSGAFILPIRRSVIFPPGSEIVVYGGSAFLLYAVATGGHTWSGQIDWEER